MHFQTPPLNNNFHGGRGGGEPQPNLSPQVAKPSERLSALFGQSTFSGEPWVTLGNTRGFH